jgi:hypothetical protein
MCSWPRRPPTCSDKENKGDRSSLSHADVLVVYDETGTGLRSVQVYQLAVFVTCDDAVPDRSSMFQVATRD